MTLYLGLGSNLGNRHDNLLRALDLIGQDVGRVVAVSSFIETEPWGFTSSNAFLNAACAVMTDLHPLEVLPLTQGIERTLGRTAKSTDGVYHDRTIDIDLLLCLDSQGRTIKVNTPTLRLPHPLIAQRNFVRIPLTELGVDPDTLEP